MLQTADERLVLDNAVSIMEHTVSHISHPSEAFLEQVETDVVRLIFTSSSPVSTLCNVSLLLLDCCNSALCECECA